MNNLIQWPRAKYWDKAWNPIIGCKPCSPACENCYASAWAERFGQSFEPHESSRQSPPRKGVVFCGNMTDLFGEWVEYPNNFVGLTAEKHSAATYLYLTKRVARMCQALTGGNGITRYDPEQEREAFRLYANYGAADLCNHYFGFTAENQEWYNERYATAFMKFPEWANLWLSAEPLLGLINLKQLYPTKPLPFKWLVVGCESGPNRRPCKLEWVESIVDQCRSANVPVFVKQLDLNGKCETDINKFPEHLRIRQVPWAKEGEWHENRP